MEILFLMVALKFHRSFLEHRYPASGDSFSSNPIGSEILTQLKEDKSRQEIIEVIASRYDVEKNQFERDLEDFMSQLRDYNLLDEN